MTSPSRKISSFFLSHGSPMIAIEDSHYIDFLQSLGKNQPKAIIIFTAHWESETTQISSVPDTYDMIYDMYGFPKALYEVKYPAKGSVDLAAKVQKALDKNGIKSQLDTKRGLDHGSWTLLSRLFPKADVPVVQMSVNPFLEPKKQMEIGKALRDVECDDVMVIGSGMTVHNLKTLDIKWKGKPAEFAVKFDDWLIEKAKSKDYAALCDFMEQAPFAKEAVPRPEHLMPFFVALGCSDPEMEAKPMHQGYELKTLSWLCFQFA